MSSFIVERHRRTGRDGCARASRPGVRIQYIVTAIRDLLGHGHIATTMRCLHLAQQHLENTASPLDLLRGGGETSKKSAGPQAATAALGAVFHIDVEHSFTKALPGFRPSGRHSPFKTAPGGFVSMGRRRRGRGYLSVVREGVLTLTAAFGMISGRSLVLGEHAMEADQMQPRTVRLVS